MAVTTTSASITLPDFSLTPSGTKRSISSVTTLAWPSITARKRSPSGTKAIRWLQGRYLGVKFSFTASSPRKARTPDSSSFRTTSGSSKERRVNSPPSNRIFRRTISWIQVSSISS